MGNTRLPTGTGSGAKVWKRTVALSRTDDNPGRCQPDRVATGIQFRHAVRLSLLYLAFNITSLGIANIALRSRRFR